MDENAILKKPNHHHLQKLRPFLLACLICFVGQFPHSYMQEVYNNIAPLVEAFINNSMKHEGISEGCCGQESNQLAWAYSVTVSSVMVGDVIFSPFVGWFSDKFGRKKILLLFCGSVHISSCITLLLAKPTNIFELLGVGQFLYGFASAVTGAVNLVYLLEFSPPEWQGFVTALYGLIGGLGNLTSQVLGFHTVLGTRRLWTLMFVPSMITAITAVTAWFFYPESPYWLLEIKKDRQAARRALEFVYTKADDVTLDAMVKRMELKDTPNSAPWRQMVKFKPYLRSVLVVQAIRMMMIAEGFLGYQVFTSIIYYTFNIPFELAQYMTVIGIVVQLIVRVATLFIHHWFPNRATLLLSLGFMMIGYLILCIAPHFTASSQVATYFSVVTMILIGAIFKIPFNLAHELPAQLSPIEIRGRNVSLGRVVQNAGVMLIRLTFLPMYARVHAWTWILYLILPIPFAVFLYFELPETQGKTSREIMEHWGQPSLFFSGESAEEQKYTHLVDEGKKGNKQPGNYGATGTNHV